MDGCPGGVKYRAINKNGAINKWLLNYIQKETFFLNFQLRQKLLDQNLSHEWKDLKMGQSFQIGFKMYFPEMSFNNSWHEKLRVQQKYGFNMRTA